MIRVRYSRDQQGHITTLKISGHAAYAEHGQDIVCSAVSVLVQTVIYELERYQIKFDYRIASGDVEINLDFQELNERETLQADTLLEACVNGIRQVRLASGASYIDDEEE